MDDGTGSVFAEYGFVVRTRIGLVRCYGALAAGVRSGDLDYPSVVTEPALPSAAVLGRPTAQDPGSPDSGVRTQR